MILLAMVLALLTGAPQLRFHHIHLKVADPARAMSSFAQKVGGTRVILQGIGVAVRTDGYYVVFDRAAADELTAMTPTPEYLAGRYRRAVAGLGKLGADVTPAELPAAVAAAASAAAIPGLVAIEHIGFTTGDFGAAIEAIAASGVETLDRRADGVAFRIDGYPVEIVRDTDRPDAFWCPMHLDVRSPDPGKCPVCSMDLVRIPPLRLGEYRLDVDVLPRGLTLRVADPDGKPVSEFVTVHERAFHLFIVSRDLSYFAHVHPDAVAKAAGAYRLPLDANARLKPGAYMAIADVLPYGGTSQMLHRAFVTPGYRGPVFTAPPPLTPGPTDAVVDGVRIRIDADLAPRKEGTIRFALSDATTGAPVTDLEPFLGAPAHMLIVNADLTDAIHAHPEEQQTPGPSVSFAPLMPAPGAYKLWVQFQRRGKVFTAPFVVAVK